MNVVALFVLGLLFGWLAEWAIDWYYWRPRISRVADENTGLRERIAFLETKKTPVRVSSKNLPLIDANGNHNFQAIKGVGPVFARRLREAGILTFDQLSRLKTSQLEQILGKLFKRFFSKQESILGQAKEFAKQVAEKN
jgi:predicted flap endonuclease-1-like 5' DNA nuclease